MFEIVVHESAAEDLIGAAVFYESRETDLGNEFLEELSQSFERIIKSPFAYSSYFDEYRRYLMGRFPYSVVYRIEGHQILVFAVAHLHRQPGYWRARDWREG
jgi:plasmid stabilization system protein ParE